LLPNLLSGNMVFMTQVNVPIYDPAESKSKGNQLYLTPSAIQHIKKILTKQVGEKSFRLSVKRAGCSGFAYVVDYIDSFDSDDLKFSIDDELVVFVDRASFPILQGICIDYVQSGLNGTLKFINPNQTAACGCGESFSIEEKIED
jgi:iron-sulfur cluster assembly accessory protein